MAKLDHYLKIHPPSPDMPGKYFLIIYSRPNPFGGGGSVIVPCDDLAVKTTTEGIPISYEVYLAGELMVTFPGSFDYLMLHKSRGEMVAEADRVPTTEGDGEDVQHVPVDRTGYL